MRRKRVVLTAVAAVVAISVVPATASARSAFKAHMNGGNIPLQAGAPNGYGKARIALRNNAGTICFKVSFHNIGRRVGLDIGIYSGTRFDTGGEAVELVGTPGPSPRRGCVSASQTLIKDIRTHPGHYHVTVKNDRYNRLGAIRGQLQRVR